MSSPILIDNVQKVFKTPGGDVVALKDINLTVQPGEFVCLLGPWGCGKSTLLNAVAGFQPRSDGQSVIDQKTIRSPGPDR
uniref:ATP-binding cassette domain-containing protein n=1 Tax=Proteus faecis TaxID=2050967 RepID=UPI00301E2594